MWQQFNVADIIQDTIRKQNTNTQPLNSKQEEVVLSTAIQLIFHIRLLQMLSAGTGTPYHHGDLVHLQCFSMFCPHCSIKCVVVGQCHSTLQHGSLSHSAFSHLTSGNASNVWWKSSLQKKATCASVKTGSRNSQQDTPGTHVGKVYFCERISLP